jgi:hypothetical protein
MPQTSGSISLAIRSLTQDGSCPGNHLLRRSNARHKVILLLWRGSSPRVRERYQDPALEGGQKFAHPFQTAVQLAYRSRIGDTDMLVCSEALARNQSDMGFPQ